MTAALQRAKCLALCLSWCLGVLVVTTARAQVKSGDASMNMSGTVSLGYSEDTTNLSGSDHSFVGAGTADMTGSYYNPNFLSFDVQPFYNQSRLNSTFQSLTAASGVNANVKLFSGSDFPGSISYSRTYNSTGSFGIPGLANYTTHGNNDTFGVLWGIHKDDLPSLNLSFTTGDNSYSIYGTNSLGRLHSDTFTATTTYQMAGFNLNGGYQHSGSLITTPDFLTGGSPQRADSGVNSFTFGVGHNLPWHGSFSAGAMSSHIRTSFGDGSAGFKYDTTIDTLNGALNFAPAAHLNIGANTYYTDNLEGTLFNSLLTAGLAVPQLETQQSSHDLSVTAFGNYELPAQHLVLHGFVERQQQSFLGLSFASNSYNGTATYSNVLLGGSFNGVLGVTRTSIDTTHLAVTGLTSSANYTHQIQRWTLSGGVNYSQDTQTVLIAYTSSGFGYSGSVGRRIRRRSYWGAYVSGARSVLTDQPGTANASHSYSTSLALPHFSINGTYSASSGNALLTSTGLVPTPVPVPILTPAAVMLYNGKSYSVGIGSSPLRGLTLSASYARALSGTESALTATSSNNKNDNMDFRLVYNFRKMNFTTGYDRLYQGFSLLGTPPAMVGSFYVGISRWFNFF